MRKRLIALCVCAAVTVGWSSVAVADFKDGYAAYKRGDYATALKELRPLAEQGHARAQNGLGVMYNKGQGVPRNDKEAVKWYRKAVEQGEAIAQYNLGVMYDMGQGVAQDYKEAVKLYRKAAEQRYAIAQNSLGRMYGEGKGVIRDYVHAHMWFNIGAAYGSENARKNRDIIEEKITATDISRAQTLAKEWMAKHQK